jgi:hypothetical protein
MSRIASFSIALTTLLGASLALASQEGVLTFGTFRVESPGIGNSGVVTVAGRQGAQGVESLRIEAFGKRFDLSRDQLQALQGSMLNGLQLSYEGGYKELGGRTLYIVFSKGFTSGVVSQRLVTVTEDGAVKVGAAP